MEVQWTLTGFTKKGNCCHWFISVILKKARRKKLNDSVVVASKVLVNTIPHFNCLWMF